MKPYLLVFLLSFVAGVSAQAQDRIQQIRELYSSAMAGVKEQRESVEPVSNLSLTIRRMEPAIGAVTYEKELYLQTNEHQCAFYRNKRTAGPYEPTVQEALLDAAGHVIFVFTRETFVYDQTTWRYEERFYFNEDGSLNKLLRKGIWADGKPRPLTDDDFVNNAGELKQTIEDFFSTYSSQLSVPDYDDEP